jgi:hypothetical protein
MPQMGNLKDVFQIPIGTSKFKYQLVLQIPIGTSNTNWYQKYQLVPQIPIGTTNTNWYFKYYTMSNDPPRKRTTTTATKWI